MTLPSDMYRYIRCYLSFREAHRFREVMKDLRRFENWELERIYQGADFAYLVRIGDLIGLRYMVTRVANTNVKYNYTLYTAAQTGRLDIVRFLVEYGSDIHNNNDYALRAAAITGHLDVIRFFIKCGEVLSWVTANGHLDVIRFGIYIDADGLALAYAAANGHLDLVSFLVELNSTSSQANNTHNNYALHLAAGNGHIDVVRFLVKHGADIYVNNNYDIHWSCIYDHSLSWTRPDMVPISKCRCGWIYSMNEV